MQVRLHISKGNTSQYMRVVTMILLRINKMMICKSMNMWAPCIIMLLFNSLCKLQPLSHNKCLRVSFIQLQCLICANGLTFCTLTAKLW